MDMSKTDSCLKENGYRTFSYGNTCECDKISPNSNRIRKNNRGSSMKEENYEQLEMEHGGMQMILKFPKEQKGEEHIKKDVKQILSNILQEYIERIS